MPALRVSVQLPAGPVSAGSHGVLQQFRFFRILRPGIVSCLSGQAIRSVPVIAGKCLDNVWLMRAGWHV
ncbi:MAG: hypothetical protein COT71_03490 [Candidatus Andersenbacteria bacterium CG10_big_fil_rev_8_21_14_0_10_54_11]|uniref:Uncharacterized protein n=1 Tax=Candidatus Andersenbacteria bacterium CG10_big_fil_rev_8_21_14_0_10_54_11 TaxID=1974485 RepID=A0A2M6WYW7_9BACT|nr:MAG: hypothetical protein COT71_03490 [Candidatus Andersenbacteria bacterium CG10_big_fil_rev_8_21_14_0_10_54_11]